MSINTDDPSLLGTTVVDEYVQTATAFGWDADAARDVARTSIEASFCSEDRRAQLLQALEAWRPGG